MNQYAHFIGRSITQNYEPDAWFSTFRGDKYHYMWGALYQSELEFPDWGNADFNGARIQGMRYFTRRCVAGSGTPPPPPIGTRTRPGLAVARTGDLLEPGNAPRPTNRRCLSTSRPGPMARNHR
jgi:hypothetical protein